MRHDPIVNGHREQDRKPKVLIARSIVFLSTAILYPLFQRSNLLEQGDEREMEEFRSAWLLWLSETPRAAFLSYIDSYHQFLSDLEAGHWSPNPAPEPAPRTALDALGARINGDRT